MATNFFTFDGKTYVLPSEGDTAWLWYRKDLFEKASLKPPETWEEFYAAAKALNDPANGVYGAVIGAKPDEAWWDFMYYLFGQGGELLNPDNTVAINNEAGVKALTFYSNLLKEGLVPLMCPLTAMWKFWRRSLRVKLPWVSNGWRQHKI